MQSDSQKLSIREKIGFSLGDCAANFIFQTIMMLQLTFYTDSFGLGATAIAVLFLVGRLVGAFADPVMGVIADRTETKWGKFRPWILWTAVPFGIFGFLAFFTPDISYAGKVIWAFVTYILLMLVYSANNIPYSALSGVITGDQKERSSLFSVRFVFVTIAILAIQGFAFPMVHYFGRTIDAVTGQVVDDSARGFMITMGIFSVLAVLFFFATFSWTKERIKPNPEQKQSLKQDISDLLNNKPWVVMFLVFTMMFVFLAIRNGMLRYYFLYFMDIPSMTNFINSINGATAGLLEKLNFAGEKAFIPDSVFSISNILGQFAAILGIVVSNYLLTRLGKKNTFMLGLVLAGLSVLFFYFVSPTSIGLAIFLQVLYNFSWGITMPVPWAMMADVADFSDWKFNRRSTAIVFAGIVIGLKVGLAIGGALSSMLLKWYGYVAPAPKQNWTAQTPQAIHGIHLSNSLFLVFLLAVVIIFLFFYQISKGMELKMQDELAERRKSFNA